MDDPYNRDCQREAKIYSQWGYFVLRLLLVRFTLQLACCMTDSTLESRNTFTIADMNSSGGQCQPHWAGTKKRRLNYTYTWHGSLAIPFPKYILYYINKHWIFSKISTSCRDFCLDISHSTFCPPGNHGTQQTNWPVIQSLRCFYSVIMQLLLLQYTCERKK